MHSTRDLLTRKVNWVLDLDIKKFFDGLSTKWLVKFTSIGWPIGASCGLIQKWLNAGVPEMMGTNTGGVRNASGAEVASPLLPNVYLHYVFDDCGPTWRRKSSARGCPSSCDSLTMSWFLPEYSGGRTVPVGTQRRMRKFQPENCIPRKRAAGILVRLRSTTGKGRGEGKPRDIQLFSAYAISA